MTAWPPTIHRRPGRGWAGRDRSRRPRRGVPKTDQRNGPTRPWRPLLPRPVSVRASPAISLGPRASSPFPVRHQPQPRKRPWNRGTQASSGGQNRASGPPAFDSPIGCAKSTLRKRLNRYDFYTRFPGDRIVELARELSLSRCRASGWCASPKANRVG